MTGPSKPPTMRLRLQRGDPSVTPDAEGDTRGDTGSDVASAPASPASVTPSVASVVPLSIAARAGVAVRRGGAAIAEAARELWLLPDRFLHVIIHGRAETMAEHRAHIKSRAWVPDGMAGGAEKAVIIAGIAHHLLIARPLKASMKTVKFAAEKIDQAADRPLPLYLTAILVIGLIVLLARYL